MHVYREDCGPMKAMMLGRLSFSGSYGEAMGNMGPFTNFLRLVGKSADRLQGVPETGAPPQ